MWQWGRRECRPLVHTPASTPQLAAAVEVAAELAAVMVAPVAAGCSMKLEDLHWRWPDSLGTAVESQALRLP